MLILGKLIKSEFRSEVIVRSGKERQKTILSSRLLETSRALDAVNNQISNMK